MHKSQIKYVSFAIFLCLCSTYCKPSMRSELWYKYAVEYVKADEVMAQHIIEKKESFLDDFKLQQDAETRLLSTKAPSLHELEQLLNSSEGLDKKVALVNIMKRRVYFKRLFEIIFKINDARNNYFIKFYSLACLKNLQSATFEQFESELINIVNWETDESFLLGSMPILVRMDRSKVVPLFVRFLKNCNRNFRNVAFVYLKQMEQEALAEVKDILGREDALEALAFIKAVESGKIGKELGTDLRKESGGK